MSFDRLISHFDSDAGEKEQTALVVYYLEKEEAQDNIAQSEVRNVIQRSRSSISTSNVSTYFGRLRNDGWLTSTENDGYRLTHTGEDQVEALLDDEALDNPRQEDDLFIDTADFEQNGDRYEQLVKDINETYRYRIYDATMVLTRKFFEDLVFQILKTHYAGDNVQMFYDQENQRHYSFDELLDNLRESVPTLRQYSRELDRELINDLRELKEEGNSGAHAIRVDFTNEEVEGWSDDATLIADILYDVLVGVRIAEREGED